MMHSFLACCLRSWQERLAGQQAKVQRRVDSPGYAERAPAAAQVRQPRRGAHKQAADAEKLADMRKEQSALDESLEALRVLLG